MSHKVEKSQDNFKKNRSLSCLDFHRIEPSSGLINWLSQLWWVKCILRYSPAGEGVEGTTPDTEDTKIDRSYIAQFLNFIWQSCLAIALQSLIKAFSSQASTDMQPTLFISR